MRYYVLIGTVLSAAALGTLARRYRRNSERRTLATGFLHDGRAVAAGVIVAVAALAIAVADGAVATGIPTALLLGALVAAGVARLRTARR